MAMLTKAEVLKGEPSVFTLKLSDLLASPLITDSYFKQATNIAEVSFRWTAGNQFELVKFPVPQGHDPAVPLKGKFEVSLTSKDNFNIAEISLRDFDGDTFEIHREHFSAEQLAALDIVPYFNVFVAPEVLGGTFDPPSPNAAPLSGGTFETEVFDRVIDGGTF